MISFLCKNRMIRFIDDTYAVLQNRASYSIDTLYCIWVMLDRIDDSIISESMEITTAKSCIEDGGINLCYINGKKKIEYIAYLDNTNLTTVAYIQDTFYTATGAKVGEEEKTSRKYIFVVRDEEVMEKLAEMRLTIPFAVAYVEGNVADVPTIEYYELS